MEIPDGFTKTFAVIDNYYGATNRNDDDDMSEDERIQERRMRNEFLRLAPPVMKGLLKLLTVAATIINDEPPTEFEEGGNMGSDVSRCAWCGGAYEKTYTNQTNEYSEIHVELIHEPDCYWMQLSEAVNNLRDVEGNYDGNSQRD